MNMVQLSMPGIRLLRIQLMRYKTSKSPGSALKHSLSSSIEFDERDSMMLKANLLLQETWQQHRQQLQATTDSLVSSRKKLEELTECIEEKNFVIDVHRKTAELALLILTGNSDDTCIQKSSPADAVKLVHSWLDQETSIQFVLFCFTKNASLNHWNIWNSHSPIVASTSGELLTIDNIWNQSSDIVLPGEIESLIMNCANISSIPWTKILVTDPNAMWLVVPISPLSDSNQRIDLDLLPFQELLEISSQLVAMADKHYEYSIRLITKFGEMNENTKLVRDYCNAMQDLLHVAISSSNLQDKDFENFVISFVYKYSDILLDSLRILKDLNSLGDYANIRNMFVGSTDRYNMYHSWSSIDEDTLKRICQQSIETKKFAIIKLKNVDDSDSLRKGYFISPYAPTAVLIFSIKEEKSWEQLMNRLSDFESDGRISADSFISLIEYITSFTLSRSNDITLRDSLERKLANSESSSQQIRLCLDSLAFRFQSFDFVDSMVALQQQYHSLLSFPELNYYFRSCKLYLQDDSSEVLHQFRESVLSSVNGYIFDESSCLFLCGIGSNVFLEFILCPEIARGGDDLNSIFSYIRDISRIKIQFILKLQSQTLIEENKAMLKIRQQKKLEISYKLMHELVCDRTTDLSLDKLFLKVHRVLLGFPSVETISLSFAVTSNSDESSPDSLMLLQLYSSSMSSVEVTQDDKSVLSCGVEYTFQYRNIRGRVVVFYESKLSDDILRRIQDQDGFDFSSIGQAITRKVFESYSTIQERSRLSTFDSQISDLQSKLKDKSSLVESLQTSLDLDKDIHERRVLEIESALSEQCKLCESLNKVINDQNDITMSLNLRINALQFENEKYRDRVEVFEERERNLEISKQDLIRRFEDVEKKHVTYKFDSKNLIEKLQRDLKTVTSDLNRAMEMHIGGSEVKLRQVLEKVARLEQDLQGTRGANMLLREKLAEMVQENLKLQTALDQHR